MGDKMRVQPQPAHREDEVNLQTTTTWYGESNPIAARQSLNPDAPLRMTGHTQPPEHREDEVNLQTGKAHYAEPTKSQYIDVSYDPVCVSVDDGVSECTRFNALFSYETVFGDQYVDLQSCDESSADTDHE